MTKKTKNPLAFPCETHLLDEYPSKAGHDMKVRHTGMTLRDYFAAKAMQGMLSGIYSKEYKKTAPEKALERLELVIKNSYWFADEMLKQREL